MSLPDAEKKRLTTAAVDLITCQERNNDWLDFLFELQCEVMKGDQLDEADLNTKMDVTIKFRLLRNFFKEVEAIDHILNPQ